MAARFTWVSCDGVRGAHSLVVIRQCRTVTHSWQGGRRFSEDGLRKISEIIHCRREKEDGKSNLGASAACSRITVNNDSDFCHTAGTSQSSRTTFNDSTVGHKALTPGQSDDSTGLLSVCYRGKGTAITIEGIASLDFSAITKRPQMVLIKCVAVVLRRDGGAFLEPC